MTPGEAGKLIMEMAKALQKLQDQVDGLTLSLERLQLKIEFVETRQGPSPQQEANA